MVTEFYSPLGKMNVLDVVIRSIQTFLCASGEKLRKSLSSGSKFIIQQELREKDTKADYSGVQEMIKRL